MNDKAIRAAKLTAGAILDKKRAKEAVSRAGGQIAPSKYLPDVPRQAHASGGYVPGANLPVGRLAVAKGLPPPPDTGFIPMVNTVAGLADKAMGFKDYLQEKGIIGGGEQALSDASGSYTGETPSWITYANQGATRDQPLNPRMYEALGFLPEMGITAEVFSGGQPAIGTSDKRVGSTRHDHGLAGDMFFIKDGRRLDWANQEDIPIFQEIVRRGTAGGLTGWGAGPGYMRPGSMHVGFGNAGVWGDGGRSENAPYWLREAYYGSDPNMRGTRADGGAVDEGFEDYLKTVNPKGTSIDADARPNLAMGDMYGMLPRGSRQVAKDGPVTYHRSPDGGYYAMAHNPDIGERDVIGYAIPRGDETELAVVQEMQGKGIGGKLQYLFRKEHPNHPTGGLTEAGKGALRSTYEKLRSEGIVKADGGSISERSPMFEGTHEDLKGTDLWHGTPGQPFDSFDDKKVGQRDAGFFGEGHYLTPERGNAEGYADPDEMGRGSVIGPLHAALKNPYIWDTSDDNASHRTLRDLQSMGIMRGQGKLEPWDIVQRHEMDKFMRNMRDRGHDGVIVRTKSYDDRPHRISEVVVFNPNMIKHRDAEVGDPNDPRIMRAHGGILK